MKLLSAQRGNSVRRRISRRRNRVDALETTNHSVDEYRRQVQLLRSRNRRLEIALADVVEASDAALLDVRRNEAELRQRIDQSRSSFEIAWTGFTAESAIEDHLSSLDPGDDRARRWLLTP